MSKIANLHNQLTQISQRSQPVSFPDIEQDVLTHCRALHKQAIQHEPDIRASYEHIPRFYYPLANKQDPPISASIHNLFTASIHGTLIERVSELSITRRQFELIVSEIEQRCHRELGTDQADMLIDYSTFHSCGQHLSAEQRQLFAFSPQLFGLLATYDSDNMDEHVTATSANHMVSTVSALRLVFHLLHENQVLNLLIALQCYCLNMNASEESETQSTPSMSKLPNRISENDLMNFVYDSLDDIDATKVLSASFHPYYVFTVVRKIIFFLDPSHRGSCDIYSLARSSFCNEFLAMKATRSMFSDSDNSVEDSKRICAMLMQMQDTLTIGASRASRLGLEFIGSAPPSLLYTSVTDPGKLPPQFSTSNDKLSWFHPVNAQQLYNLYMELDTDGNGMLTKEEISRIRKGGLNPMFIDVLFTAIMLYHNPANDQYEMDYKGYLDLMLALEYAHTRPAIQWLFSLLDINRCGYLDHAVLCYWFKPIRDKLLSLRADAAVVSCDVMANELIDMAGASWTEKITLQMLLDSGVGHTVLMCLIDCVYFHQYDNRESQQQQ